LRTSRFTRISPLGYTASDPGTCCPQRRLIDDSSNLGGFIDRDAAGSATISLIQPATEFDPRINQLDLRLTRALRLNTTRLRAIVDLYNVFNRNTALVINTTYGPSWLNPTQIMDGRLLKLGFQLEF